MSMKAQDKGKLRIPFLTTIAALLLVLLGLLIDPIKELMQLWWQNSPLTFWITVVIVIVLFIVFNVFALKQQAQTAQGVEKGTGSMTLPGNASRVLKHIHQSYRDNGHEWQNADDIRQTINLTPPQMQDIVVLLELRGFIEVRGLSQSALVRITEIGIAISKTL
jgi:hypothetical protein